MSIDGELLEKAVWSDDDFDEMGWHDAHVHAVGVESGPAQRPEGVELLLDIDYIVRWIDPVTPDEYFTFIVAPATLAFHDVCDLEGHFEDAYRTPFEIDEITRAEPDGRGLREWTIESVGPGGLSATFIASGFHQHFRSLPKSAGRRQYFTSEERGGLSFARPAGFDSSG